MSIHDHASFLKGSSLPPVFNVKHLDIPDQHVSEPKGQEHALVAGTVVRIQNADRDRANTFEIISYKHYTSVGWRYYLLDPKTGGDLMLSNWQITQLQSQGRFLRCDSKVPEGQEIDQVGSLSKHQRAIAEKKLRYVLAILKENSYLSKAMPDDRRIRESAARHAKNKEGGEKPPCLTTLKEAICNYYANPAAALLALAPGKTRGNRNKKYSERILDLVRESAEYAWSLPKGTAKDARKRYAALLALSENEHLRKEVCDEHGNVLWPKQRTFERAKKNVPHFVRDLLRYGEEYAMRVHSIKIPQLLPAAPFDLVEVDFVKTDTCIYDDRIPEVYGRAWAIFFKDRNSGGVAGWSVFFGAPNFEAFLAGFKHMVFPKDNSEHPEIEISIHGFPVAMAVDADVILRGDQISALCEHFGIMLYELNAGHADGKGSLERYFRTQNDLLFHNLPGGTMSNPERRGQFDDDKGVGCPKMSLSELKRSIAAFVHQYNNTHHRGLGYLRNWSGIPQKRYDDGIGRARQRPTIDPEVFAAFANEVEWLSVQHGTITWDYITYYDPKLTILAMNGNATAPARSGDRRKERKTVTRYKCVRDPSDLGHIYVHVPELNTVIIAFAHGECRRYAKGLRLFQHNKAKEHHKKTTGEPPLNIKDFIVSKAAYEEGLKAEFAERKSQKTGEAVASFYRTVTRTVKRSELVDVKPDAEKSRKKIDYTRNSSTMADAPRLIPKPAPDGIPDFGDPSPTQDAARPAASEAAFPATPAAEPAKKPEKQKKATQAGRVVHVEEHREELDFDELLARYQDEVKEPK